MAFILDKYAALRPYRYHLTAASNVEHLRADPRLISTAAPLRAAGRDALIREKRRTMTAIADGDRTVILRDQKPLHASYVSLQGG